MRGGVAILGMGQISACGAGVGALGSALRSEPPKPDQVECFQRANRIRLPVFLADTTGAEAVLGAPAVRRLDGFSKHALVAAQLARNDAGTDLEDRGRVGLVLATGYGPITSSLSVLEQISSGGDGLGSPTTFVMSVHNAAAAMITQALDVRGPCATYTGFSLSWGTAVESAVRMIESGVADLVYVAAADEFHEILAYWMLESGLCPADSRMQPLDFEANSLVPGETYAAMLLGSRSSFEAKYGVLHSPAFRGEADPELGDLLQGKAAFLAAQGLASQGPAYRRVAAAATSAVSHTQFWGGNPTSDAMTTVAAALAMQAGKDVMAVSCDDEGRTCAIPLSAG